MSPPKKTFAEARTARQEGVGGNGGAIGFGQQFLIK